MTITMSQQTLIFLYSCVLGVGLSLYLDIFRVIRLVLGNPKLVTFVCDLLYFLSSTLIVYLFFVRYCSGQVRVYVLVGALLGFLFCHFSISVLFMHLAVWVVKWIRRFWGALARPFVKFGRFVGKKIQKRRQQALENRKKHKKIPENGLQPKRHVVYNLFKLYRKKPKKEDAALEEAKGPEA